MSFRKIILIGLIGNVMVRANMISLLTLVFAVREIKYQTV